MAFVFTGPEGHLYLCQQVNKDYICSWTDLTIDQIRAKAIPFYNIRLQSNDGNRTLTLSGSNTKDMLRLQIYPSNYDTINEVDPSKRCYVVINYTGKSYSFCNIL